MEKYIIIAVDEDSCESILHIVAAVSKPVAIEWFSKNFPYVRDTQAYPWAEWSAMFAEHEQMSVEQIQAEMAEEEDRYARVYG